MKNAVIGIGNPNRGDDGIGKRVIEVLEKLKAKGEFKDVELVHLLSSDLKLLDYLLGKNRVIIVDAIKTGFSPGEIIEINPLEDEIKFYHASGTHSLSIFEVLKIGYEIFKEEMPEKLKIIGIEAKDLESWGSELSPEVEKALREVIKKIKNFLKGREKVPAF